MDDILEEDDKDALAEVANAPPHWMAHSYSQQIRAGGSNKRNQMRTRGLDEDRIVKSADSCYDSSDDDLCPYSTSGADGEISHRYDHSLSTYDFDSNEKRQTMLEFIASGSATGIFKPPTRAAVHPNRPAALELRPHPLLETQIHSDDQNATYITESIGQKHFYYHPYQIKNFICSHR
ncbi:hypothetical protein Ancab_008645 [Ancistrocladus abbreviatus]